MSEDTPEFDFKQYNVQSHKAVLYNRDILSHPTYSPDLAPSDYQLFASIVHPHYDK